jgi:hypothetical protein
MGIRPKNVFWAKNCRWGKGLPTDCERKTRSSLRTTSARMDHDVSFVVFDFLFLPLGCS